MLDFSYFPLYDNFKDASCIYLYFARQTSDTVEAFT